MNLEKKKKNDTDNLPISVANMPDHIKDFFAAISPNMSKQFTGNSVTLPKDLAKNNDITSAPTSYSSSEN